MYKFVKRVKQLTKIYKTTMSARLGVQNVAQVT